MYAVVKTGGKQYRVSEGDTILVEKLEGNPGDKIALNDVLLVAKENTVQLGRPQVTGASVAAEIVAQTKAPKIIVFKYKRRKKYRRKNGNRQPQTALRITGIDAAAAQ